MQLLKFIVYLLVTITLAGCAAAKSVRNADDIIDDGKRNSVVLSYDIRMDAHDRLPGFERTELGLRCGPYKSINPYRVCFYIRAAFSGKRQENGYIYDTFTAAGTKVYQMKYGDYSLAKASYSVVVGQRRDRVCYPSKRHRRYRCYDEYVDVKSDYIATMSEPQNFSISAGDGCYLGHLTLHLRGNKIIEYDLDTTYSAERLAQLPEQTRAKAQARITAPCIS